VKRSAEETSAAKVTSARKENRRSEPNFRPDLSKPDPAASSQAGEAPPDEPAGDTSIEIGLAPGLYLVATPIGNLADITLRALAVLRAADRIWCEDTRVTRKLLARYQIATPLEPYHDHNAEQVRPGILAALRRGERIALVSDAGTPLISDPGYKLVRAAVSENLPVSAAPGPSAALTALILSGLPPDTFLFAGFLPPRRAARQRALERWVALEATLIFFESTQRLPETLADMAQIFGYRAAAVARELTKLHEEVRRGNLAELADHYRNAGPPRGEAVIVIGPPEQREPDRPDVEDRLRAALAELGVRDAAAKLAAETGLPRGELYRRALAIRGERK
jgi:16S rRNA (cytidine1402-2'-O)-methyltransferase